MKRIIVLFICVAAIIGFIIVSSNLGVGGYIYSSDGVTFNYIPKGFELTEKDVTKSSMFFSFKNDEKFFQFVCSSIHANSSVDTENGSVEEVSVNEEAAIYVNTPRGGHLVWSNADSGCSIHGNISKREMIKIAEKVLILN